MGGRLFRIVSIFLLILIPLPLAIVAAVSFSPAEYIDFPPAGFSLRWYQAFLTTPTWMTAFAFSTAVAVVAAILTTGLAVLAALGLQGSSARSRGGFDLLALLPLIFPHAAVGVAFMSILLAFRMNGTFGGILLVHIIICVPFAYRPIAVSLAKLDLSLVEAAMICGATPAQAIRRVVLPVMRPGIITSLLFAFIFSFDEVTISMFLVSPEVKTLPVAIYAHIHDSADPIVAAISTLLIAITVAVVLGLERWVGLTIFVEDGDAYNHAAPAKVQ